MAIMDETTLDAARIVGGRSLSGAVTISGSKNAALALLSGSLLVDGLVRLNNVPKIRDIYTMLDILDSIGVKSAWNGSSVTLKTSGLDKNEPPTDLVAKMRASFYIFGPMMARLGRAVMPDPGGCDIGNRPVNYHLNGLQAMGATIIANPGQYEGAVDSFAGAKIYLDLPSAGATQHLMTVATIARGSTTIENAAAEPEVVNLAGFLAACGADIEGVGSPTITINGVHKLKREVEFDVIPDRLEAGTFAISAVVSKGQVILKNADGDHLQALFSKMRDAGVEIEERDNEISISGHGRPKAVDITTMPYPGFPTDLQQPMCAMLAIADGASLVKETLYEKRVGHVPELQRMGADINADGRTIVIRGVDRLHAASMRAQDLRGGAALVLAALAAEGESEVHNMKYVDRGYERFEDKLRGLGADIERFSTDRSGKREHVSPNP